MTDQEDGRRTPPEASSTFAAKLDELFRAAQPIGRKPISPWDVAREISSGDFTVSGQYLWALRRGTRHNPTKRVVDALVAFFGVPSSYFDENSPAAEAGETEREVEVVQIAHRARGLSPAALRAVLAMVEHARTVEGLADDEDQVRQEPS